MGDSAEELKAHLRAQIASIESSSSAFPNVDARSSSRNRVERKAVNRSACLNREPKHDPFNFDGAIMEAADVSSEVPPEDPREEQERAFRKVERLALVREQASSALRARLLREGFSERAVESALERALACGLVDDVRFAEVLVRSRVSQGRGAQGIEAELAKLDIEASVVTGWPEEFFGGYESEVNRALSVLERRPPRSKNKREAAYRRLAQKGFGASISATAARLWAESHAD